jgi:type I restriction enzyme M protein
MLSVSEKYIHDLNADAQPKLFGQDWNDEAWAVCKSDMLIKGEDADNIILGDTFTKDGFDRDTDGNKWTFDYMLANPPFGVEWKQQQRYIEQERDTLGFGGRFGAGTPRVNDGALLFLQHMLSKMRAPQDGGSRVAIVFNGSPLFTGDAGGGESEIRRWIIENDWLEAIVALPEQLFYNTGIPTYLWVLTNRKQKPRKGKVHLIDARAFWVQMEKSRGNKRRRIGDPSDEKTKKDPDHIGEITNIFGDFQDGDTRTFTEEDPVTHKPVQRKRVVSKRLDNEDFGYHKVTVDRPLRLNFQASAERIARLEDESGFKNLASSAKKDPAVRLKEIEAGHQRQEEIRSFLGSFAKTSKEKLFKDRKEFLTALRDVDRANNVRLSAPELKAVLAALSERDGTANICLDRDGQPESDAELRDTEIVPLKESIEAYFKREVLPHVPDAWIDTTKTKVGYEIPLNRLFYRYDAPRPLSVIETDIKSLEGQILELLREITA